MEGKEIAGYKLIKAFGEGSTGRLFFAKRISDGKASAMKVFEPLAINRDYLDALYAKLGNLKLDQGLVKPLAYDFKKQPCHLAYAWRGGIKLGNERASSLENLCGRLEDEEAWELVIFIAGVLAKLHRNGISHGNIKPSNLLISSEDPLKPQLVDIGLGWLGSLYRFGFTDTFFYCCPEQILQPNLAFSETRFTWDVYSFGAMAYRLISGKFPRGHKQFVGKNVDGEGDPGSEVRPVMSAKQIVTAIEQEREIHWHDEKKDEHKQKLRQIILRCLELDNNLRFYDMREVELAFRNCLNENRAKEAERKATISKRETENRLSKARNLSFALVCALALMSYFAVDNFFKHRSSKQALDKTIADQSEIKAKFSKEVDKAKLMSRQELKQIELSQLNEKKEILGKLKLYAAHNRQLNDYLSELHQLSDKLLVSLNDKKAQFQAGFKAQPELAKELVKFYQKLIDEQTTNEAKAANEVLLAKSYQHLFILEDSLDEKEMALEYCREAKRLWLEVKKEGEKGEGDFLTNVNKSIAECDFYLLQNDPNIENKIDKLIKLEKELARLSKAVPEDKNLKLMLAECREKIAKEELKRNKLDKARLSLENAIKDLSPDFDESVAKMAFLKSALADAISFKEEKHARNLRVEARQDLENLLKKNSHLALVRLVLNENLIVLDELEDFNPSSDGNEKRLRHLLNELKTPKQKLPLELDAKLNLQEIRLRLLLAKNIRANKGARAALPEIKKALQMIEKSPSKFSKSKENLLVAATYAELGALCHELKMPEARTHAEKAAKIFAKIDANNFISHQERKDYHLLTGQFFCDYADMFNAEKKVGISKELYLKAKDCFESARKLEPQDQFLKTVLDSLSQRFR